MYVFLRGLGRYTPLYPAIYRRRCRRRRYCYRRLSGFRRTYPRNKEDMVASCNSTVAAAAAVADSITPPLPPPVSRRYTGLFRTGFVMSLSACMHVCCSTPRCDLQEIIDALSTHPHARAHFSKRPDVVSPAAYACFFCDIYVSFFSYANVYRRDMDCHDSERDLRVSPHRFSRREITPYIPMLMETLIL